jgi:hypothetical protein
MKHTKELPARIERERRGQTNRKALRFSEALRKSVGVYVSEARNRNVPDVQVLAELGLSAATLHRWCGRKDKPATFSQVGMVRATKRVGVAPVPIVALPRLVSQGTPSIAIIGLTVSDIVELCRSLGC